MLYCLASSPTSIFKAYLNLFNPLLRWIDRVCGYTKGSERGFNEYWHSRETRYECRSSAMVLCLDDNVGMGASIRSGHLRSTQRRREICKNKIELVTDIPKKRGWETHARNAGEVGEESIVSPRTLQASQSVHIVLQQSRRWGMQAVVCTHPVSLCAQCRATILSVIVAFIHRIYTINIRNLVANVMECNGRLRWYPTCIKSRSSRYRAYCWRRLILVRRALIYDDGLKDYACIALFHMNW